MTFLLITLMVLLVRFLAKSNAPAGPVLTGPVLARTPAATVGVD